MNPLLSRSSEIDRVIASDGDPATTTTSSLAPLPAFFALRFFLFDFLLITWYVTPPTAMTITVVKILFFKTQSWIREYVELEAMTDSKVFGGGGGGLGRRDSGIHGEEDRASRRVLETFSRCLST